MATLKFGGAPLAETSSYVIRTLKCLTLIKCYVSHQNNLWLRIFDQLLRPLTPQKLRRPKQKICKIHFVFEVVTIKKIQNWPPLLKNKQSLAVIFARIPMVQKSRMTFWYCQYFYKCVSIALFSVDVLIFQIMNRGSVSQSCQSRQLLYCC